MNWTIDKSFSFAYGHRVWSQELDTEYTGSAGACLACRHLHGHEGLVKVHLASDTLDRGMVVDFKMLGWFKDFLDDALDHKFIMDIHDPLLAHECPELVIHRHQSGTLEIPKLELDVNACDTHDEGYWTPNMELLFNLPPAVREKYEGMVFVAFVPTSENLSAWLLKIARDKMAKMNIEVVAVEFWETPKSHCRVDI